MGDGLHTASVRISHADAFMVQVTKVDGVNYQIFDRMHGTLASGVLLENDHAGRDFLAGSELKGP